MRRLGFPYIRTWSRLSAVIICVLCVIGGPGTGHSQTSNGHLLPDEIQKELLRGMNSGSGTVGDSPQGQVDILYPNEPKRKFNKPSVVEQYWTERTGLELKQFGYDEFGHATPVTSRLSGALQDNYILGTGDEILVDLRGQENASYRVRVDRDGRVTLPGLTPVSAAGRRFGEFRTNLQDLIADTMIATQSFVSIGSVRQINVLVTGEVTTPGSVTLNALNSITDALLLSGGVKRTGSLRNIKIVRGEQVLRLDLYGLLANVDVSITDHLADGDRIIVNPLGPTVAVTGPVARPGIYELAPGQKAIGLDQLIQLAGGYLQPGAHRVSALRVKPDGAEQFVGLGSGQNATVFSGDAVYVDQASNVARGRVVLEGVVGLPGIYDTASHPTLRSLIGTEEKYQEDSYMLFGAISRRNPKTNFRTLVPFAPLSVLNGTFDLGLQDDDIVRVFSLEEIQTLSEELKAEEQVRELSRTRAAPSSNSDFIVGAPDSVDAAGKDAGTAAGQSDLRGTRRTLGTQLGDPGVAAGPLAAGQLTKQRQTEAKMLARSKAKGLEPDTADLSGQPLYRLTPEGNLEPIYQTYDPETGDVIDAAEDNKEDLMRRPALAFDLNDPAIRNLIGNYAIEVLGAVQAPGSYLIMPGATLDSVVAAAGGISITADLTAIEITSTVIDLGQGTSRTTRANFTVAPTELASINLNPRDVIRFREVYSDRDEGQILLAGQVRYPGQFDILRGEKLSSVLARAGGLTDIAYPYGAIFTRVSAAIAEEEGYQRAADELERQFAVIVADENVGQEGIVFVRQTITELREAKGLGRISVEADPIVLAGDPSQDIILEPGDQLYIPRRPNSVSVTGEVLSTGSYQFESGRGSRHYIDLAGGYGPVADKKRAFVLLPDGTARRLNGSLTSFRSAQIVPGSTIIVPRDLRPFRFRQFALDLSQITSQLAVSAASIAVVTRNN